MLFQQLSNTFFLDSPAWTWLPLLSSCIPYFCFHATWSTSLVPGFGSRSFYCLHKALVLEMLKTIRSAWPKEIQVKWYWNQAFDLKKQVLRESFLQLHSVCDMLRRHPAKARERHWVIKQWEKNAPFVHGAANVQTKVWCYQLQYMGWEAHIGMEGNQAPTVRRSLSFDEKRMISHQ